jgi:hypothetical protein
MLLKDHFFNHKTYYHYRKTLMTRYNNISPESLGLELGAAKIGLLSSVQEEQTETRAPLPDTSFYNNTKSNLLCSMGLVDRI